MLNDVTTLFLEPITATATKYKASPTFLLPTMQQLHQTQQFLLKRTSRLAAGCSATPHIEVSRSFFAYKFFESWNKSLLRRLQTNQEGCTY